MILCSCVEQKQVYKDAKPVSFQKEVVQEVLTSKSGKVKQGEGLFQVLQRIGIKDQNSLEIINALSDEVEFSTLKIGDEVTGFFNQDNVLKEFHFSQNPVDTHQVKLINGYWRYTFKQKETNWEHRIVEGQLGKNSTLQNDLINLGLSPSVSNDIVSVLLCKVNFRMNARQGDHFKVLLNERKFEDKIVETEVVYTYYSGRRAGKHETFKFKDEEKSSAYTAHYTDSGEALIRSGLRYPLSSMHVRSNFGWRMHPVTGEKAFHRGIDLRAQAGVSVYAAAAGVVTISNFNTFSGNQIAVKHRDNSISYYFHLQKRLVKEGSWVKAGDLIGKVGATGRVTGAHLHFGFKDSNGKWMNPLNKRMIATPKLAGSRLEKLKNQVSLIRKSILVTEARQKDADVIAMEVKNNSEQLQETEKRL